jgi:cyanate permease
MSRSATWAIIVVNIVNHFGYFIYLNWMPTYFVKVRADVCKPGCASQGSKVLRAVVALLFDFRQT